MGPEGPLVAPGHHADPGADLNDGSFVGLAAGTGPVDIQRLVALPSLENAPVRVAILDGIQDVGNLVTRLPSLARPTDGQGLTKRAARTHILKAGSRAGIVGIGSLGGHREWQAGYGYLHSFGRKGGFG